MGAAIFSVASIIGFEGPDQSRIAAQIVTGVGFLGAGAIFREGAVVSGLTTAAGLWVVASIGIAAGSGTYWLAAIGTLVALGTLYGLGQSMAPSPAEKPRSDGAWKYTSATQPSSKLC